MKPTDRARLTSGLREHVSKIAIDLRAKMRAPGITRERARQLHADEQVAEDFEVWTDLLSRRASVLWVLKSVYVRVLEDRSLLSPGRLLDLEAQQLFERLAPHLGETAFLRWVYHDLASPRGGVPELFSPLPAEVAFPSDESSRALIAFWRDRDADTGANWGFADEHFEGELMGDLYQDLDPVVKERYALCQTPAFVRTFILDRTLTPAIETFGADQVRLLDPACGSGHFLIDGLKRLVAATSAQHPDWTRRNVVDHALDRVVGIDLNDYACALARTRLVMTAAELASVTTLADSAQFHPHVYWADGLEQVERDEVRPPLQFALYEKVEDKPLATLTRSDVRVALKKVFATKFHALVANPPYIVESDDAKKAYHREKVSGRQRYVSAYRQYSLASPFTERCFQLAIKDGFVGLITSNNFMKREFGKPLVERVLATVDVTLLVDTSQAYIPFHGTPTVLIFGRSRPPASKYLRAVMGRRGEIGVPQDPATAPVWASIINGWEQPEFENEFVSVADLPRDMFVSHPWSLQGGGARALQSRLERQSPQRLLALVDDMGAGVLTRADEVFLAPRGQLTRRLGASCLRGYVAGEDVRDWSVSPGEDAVFPYGEAFKPLTPLPASVERWLWPFRSLLTGRVAFGKSQIERGLNWFEYSMLFQRRVHASARLTYGNVASHNHFALQQDAWLNNAHAPVIKLRADAKDEDYLWVLGVLNSSTACFWMKQVFHPKGATSANRNHPDPERFAHEFTATGLGSFPLPDRQKHRTELVSLSTSVNTLAQQRTRIRSAEAWQSSLSSPQALQEALENRWREHDRIRQHMVFAQEEIDWLVYYLFGLTDEWLRSPDTGPCALPRGQRAFERLLGHRSFVREAGALVRPSDAESDTCLPELAADYKHVTEMRESEIRGNEAVRLIETYMHKRLWRDSEENIRESVHRQRHDSVQLRDWLVDRVEAAVQARHEPMPLARIAADLMADYELQVVAQVFVGTAAFSLEKLLSEFLSNNSVPNHPLHIYTDTGLTKRSAWENVWLLQRREDSGQEAGDIPAPPEYSQGSRGKSADFRRNEYWRLRGPLDVPRERFIAFTEVPGRAGLDTLYGWSGYTPLQLLRALLVLDEQLEDSDRPLTDRIGLLDSAWRLLPAAAREDAAAATRLKAELQALVGPEGPSHELIDDWRKRFPPPGSRAGGATRVAVARENEGEDNESDES